MTNRPWSTNVRERVNVPGHQRLVRFFGFRLQLVLSIVVAGVAGGALAAVYMYALDGVADVIGPNDWAIGVRIASLVAVGVAITVLVRLLGAPSGVELMVDNIHIPERDDLPQARLRSLVPISLLCIGAGGTLGPEAPVVTTTGTTAFRFARRHTDLSDDEVRIVMAAGMAAGFAVLFGAPFGAALFALEIPHRRGIQYHEAIIPAVIGATMGFAVSVIAGRHGLEPVWHLPIVDHVTTTDLGWAVLAGAVGAAIAALFTLVTNRLSAAAHLVPAITRPALGGLALGGLAWWTPYALTNGEFQIDGLYGAGAATLLVAAIAKFGGAAVGVAFGWRGGFIIPLFFVGFTVGMTVAAELPDVSPVAFALGAMVAANVGVTKTPLGSALAVTEMAGAAVLPTTVIAALVSLVLTSPLGLIDAQRERVDAYGSNDDQP